MYSADYSLTRSATDQHIMTSYHDRSASIMNIVANTHTPGAMLALINMLTPEAAVIDEIVGVTPHSPIPAATPSSKLYDAIGMSKLLRVALERDVYLPLAAAIIVQGDKDRPAGTASLAVVPPNDIHRMQKGNGWIGDFYSADMMVAILTRLNCGINPGDRVLDLGCSSGSLVRVLAWAYPRADFLGCDPVRASSTGRRSI